MTARIGMDVSAVRQAAALIDARAGDLDRLVGSVDGLVGQIAGEWFGEVAIEFHESWTHQHRGALIGLVAALHAYARTARANADEQERTSSADSESGPAWIGLFSGLAGFAGGSTSAIEAELRALKSVAPHALDFDKLFKGSQYLGKALGVLAIASDAYSLVKDGAHGSLTSDAVMNDELLLAMDTATTVARVNPLAGLVLTGVSMGVTVIEQHDPALTADIFRLSPIGQNLEIGGAILDHVRDGDFNPFDIASQIAHDNQAAWSDLGHQAASATQAAVSWVGRTADDAAASSKHVVGNVVHNVGSWLHL